MSDQAKTASHSWRRFLRFSVRGMIVLVLVVAVWLGRIVCQAHIQRDAVAAIRKAGGTVAYNWEWDQGKSIPGGRPWAPSWLVDLIGVDFFGHTTAVDLELPLEWPSGPANAPLAEVGRLNQLQRLRLSHASLTDAELGDLKGVTKLSNLRLIDTQVTDAWLVHLKGLTNLSNLSLYGTQVTDAGLVHLKGLTNLSFLDVQYTHVTDAGLVHLKGLANLSNLWLTGTQVTDAGMVHLKRLTNLSSLWVYFTQVTDAGMNELKRALPNLTIYHHG
jgi:Leucine-rich repeat (LRR) protein